MSFKDSLRPLDQVQILVVRGRYVPSKSHLGATQAACKCPASSI